MNDSGKPHLLIVEARYYEELNDALLAGAKAELDQAGVSFDHITVPGALEAPAAVAMAANSGRYDGFVVLGLVIRGETYHFDIVSDVSAAGLNDLACQERLALGNGILTVENEEQAWARADANRGNKGGAAARTALHMVKVKRQMREVK